MKKTTTNELPKPLSISDYISQLNSDLQKLRARIVGEVVSFKVWSSGHAYFSLKDKKDGSVINCIMWRSDLSMCGVNLEDGMEVIAFGRPNVYLMSGKLSFVASTIELSGEGSLKKAYEELKRKLDAEGLFADERKRLLPRFPKKIGVITSRQGAVISDFLTNIGKHGFSIRLIHSGVEGQAALPGLIKAIQEFRDEDIDVLVIIRGGGSLESLQAFNNENLVREVVFFPVPVMAGIGHDKDVSLVAMAADFSASTPTAVANELDKIWEAHRLELSHFEQGIVNSFRQLLNTEMNSLSLLTMGVLDGFKSFIAQSENQLKMFARTIIASDPRRQFKLGFSISRLNGKVLKRVTDIQKESILETQLLDGVIQSVVTEIENDEKK
ncbi:MAG: exodeoxyribonuclease VII large subunit [Candidatus Harrisonbacteria bacterium CG10_big_fil_rev_8_21_14_0_10_42_17]|uniref:Exodeoxyribonuclease 7 large subunit n=1 Tax=Candidatus Harrisonbacteria bacterium CG10_big_fil_rev_8_21_14_0_10_42_17 TaxID=1974584 RepID=A0A2M6WJ24_9BACT|nr:MAG: exodeoxyribonuclease VII large subunit [Candidatus Harrisonbacteria bacterium CG10_big_fil_rev_8_21_14_0_10_42_17]